MPKLTKMGYESEVAFRLSHLKLPSWNPSLDFMPSVNLGLSGCWCRRPGPRTYFRVRCTRGLPLAKNQFEKVRDIYKRITWNLKKPFINLQMVVSISWFQIFPWEMVVSSNVHFKRVVWSSRYLYYRREGGYSGAQCCLGTRADSLRYRTPRPALVTLWWHGTLHLGSYPIPTEASVWWWMMMDDDGWWWMMMDGIRVLSLFCTHFRSRCNHPLCLTPLLQWWSDRWGCVLGINTSTPAWRDQDDTEIPWDTPKAATC